MTMIGTAGIALILSVGALAAAGHEVSVAAIEGNVFITLAGGGRRQITFGGKDYDPSLSLDERSVVFARAVQGPAVSTDAQPRGPQDRSELWIVRVDGSDPQRLFSGEVREKDRRYVHFSVPHLSLNNRYVYFLIPYAVVIDALVRLDRTTSRVRILTPAEQFTLLDRGAYKGFLLVQKRAHEEQGLVYPFWLFSPNGEPIRKVADGEAGAVAFVQQNR